MTHRFRRPSPSTVLACLALFFAIAGGSALALQGRNSVDSGDIRRAAVKAADIANNAVTTRKIRNNHVRAADIQANAVGNSELAEAEPVHRLGSPGEPPFSNGGQNDCIWGKYFGPWDPFASPDFYKDPFCEVHLTGALTNAHGPGGDGACDQDDVADATLFVLPPGFRPSKLLVVLNYLFDGTNDGAEQLFINGTAPVNAGGMLIPAGAVVALTLGSDDEQQTVLDGITFRAAGPGNPARRGVIRTPRSAAGLLDRLLGP